ncbi:MAG TPA: hypothetical protein H9684_03875 [Firmicutes bacterium]|nr:hypothetical protein [Bacillota bacterium]
MSVFPCRRGAALLAALLAAAILAPSAAADGAPAGGEADKVYRIVEEDGQGEILAEPMEDAFWEYPLLPAGQERTGRFRVVNGTPRTVALTMTPDLPVDDREALLYFSNLRVILRQADGTVAYDGPYTGLADAPPLLSFENLRAGEAAEYTVTLRCAFSYTGDPETESAPAVWNFQASARLDGSPDGEGRLSGTTKILLVVTAFLLAVSAALPAARAVRSRKRAGKAKKG